MGEQIMPKKKKSYTGWILSSIVAFLLIVIILSLVLCSRAPEDMPNNETPSTEQEAQCTTLLLGQDCEDNPGCCEEETSCTNEWFAWECKYNYPECDYPDVGMTQEWMDENNYTYEDLDQGWDIFEKWDLWISSLKKKGMAYELEQCMDNHLEFKDYCCRCPDGTTARFVYDESRDIEYMWCYENPE